MTEAAENLSRTLGVSAKFAEILIGRGIDTPEKARSFLHPSVEDLEDPFLLSGMKEAVERIRYAVDNGEKIVVFGDYDCDGITATAMLYDYLSSLRADVSYYIPNRFTSGYGLTIEILEEIAESLFPDLIITVDCGISSVEEATYLDEVLAIDLIVTDHHTLPSELPQAILVNPKLTPGSKCFDLCGAGVAFKLVEALGGMKDAWRYIELAAIATIADIMPLTEENRVITSLGLKKMNSREKINKGLRLLIESADIREKVTTYDVGFRLAPRINALGRLGDATEAVELFTTEEFVVLEGLVEKLGTANELRKSLANEVYREAIELLKEYDLVSHKIIFLYKADWNPGVLGLVAGRLAKEFTRPTVLVCGEGEIKGSARAPEGVDLYETIKSAEPYLVKFGGHKRAAGLTLLFENMIAARNAMDEYLESHADRDTFTHRQPYDMTLRPDEVTVSFAEELSLLEPTGEGNRKPLFRIDSDLCSLQSFGTGVHIKGRLNDAAEVIGFNLAYVAEGLAGGMKYSLLCECDKETYKNRDRAQLRIVEAAPLAFSESDDSLLLFNRYLRSNLYKEEYSDFTPLTEDRLSDARYDEDFGNLYLALSQESAERFLKRESSAEEIRFIEYGKSLFAPINELLFAPETDPIGYRNIILLDTPLTKGYVARLAKTTGASVYVVTDRYPYRDRFREADLSPEAVSASYQQIKEFLFMGNGATSPIDLTQKIAPKDPFAFLIHFYTLYECGALRIGQGFRLYPQSIGDLSASTLYRRIVALKKQL